MNTGTRRCACMWHTSIIILITCRADTHEIETSRLESRAYLPVQDPRPTGCLDETVVMRCDLYGRTCRRSGADRVPRGGLCAERD